MAEVRKIKKIFFFIHCAGKTQVSRVTGYSPVSSVLLSLLHRIKERVYAKKGFGIAKKKKEIRLKLSVAFPGVTACHT